MLLGWISHFEKTAKGCSMEFTEPITVGFDLVRDRQLPTEMILALRSECVLHKIYGGKKHPRP